MRNETGFSDFRRLAAGGNFVPVYREILADLLTPVSAFLRIGGRDRLSFLLESVEGGERLARYSFLGRDPFLSVSIGAGVLRLVDHRTGQCEARAVESPVAELKSLIDRYRSAPVPGLPRFTGGAVGWFGWESVRWVESLPADGRDDPGLDDCVLRFYDTVIAFDHVRHRALLIASAHLSNGAGPAELQAAFTGARDRIDRLARDLAASAPPRAAAAPAPPPIVRANLDRDRYEAMVRTALEQIRAGEIFQVVLSQRFAVETTADPFDIYRALRAINPSPYMFFLNGDGQPVIGASPEPLLRLQGGVLEYRPIAGTTPRGADEEEDRRLAEQMAADEKERAEHVMLVDLGRNDLGRVAEPGSVCVSELMTVERYSHVMHLVSRLTARLRPDRHPLDALYACFPAGTVSGAPKVRAMEIIDALEPTRRGLYGGAIGWLDFAGNLDTCIALRTMVVRGGTAYIQAGAGIVADSQPDREYQETVHKARALLAAVEMAGGGLA